MNSLLKRANTYAQRVADDNSNNNNSNENKGN